MGNYSILSIKKITFLFILFLLVIFQTNAEETFRHANTSWRIIKERLFGGDNSKAFRYEHEIRFQLKGEPDSQDSIVLNEIIHELNSLMEITNAKLVDTDGNFTITVLPPNDFTKVSTSQKTSQYEITLTELGFGQSTIPTIEEKRKYFRYYIIRHLTKLYNPRFGSSNYGGIFDSNEIPDLFRFMEIDNDIIRKLYSNDFYKNLRKNISQREGYMYYLNMRYKNTVKNTSLIIGLLLAIFWLQILITNKKYTQKNVTLKKYFKNSFKITLMIYSSYVFLSLPTEVLTTNLSLPVNFISKFVSVLIISSIAVPSIYLFERFILKDHWHLVKKQMIKFFITFFSILVSVFVLGFITNLILGLLISRYNLPISTQVPSLSIILYIFTISLIRIFFDFIVNYTESIVNKKDVELVRMKELKNQAELNALHSRINPHFLYNSLNSIAGLAHSDADKTEKMATSLSSLFRYSINKKDKTYSTVNEELEMVEKYLEVEKVRFGDKLDYTIEADENIQNKAIPKFLIQPLVENALKHGLSKITGIGRLKVKVFQEDNDLVIQVFDNGPDFPDEPVQGYGLQNLHDKLQILYGDEAILNWQNGENKNIQVTLKNQFKA